MSGLNGVRVALLEARMASEMAALVRRRGGLPYCVPAVRESAQDATRGVEELLDLLTAGEIATTVFLTGACVRALAAEAETLARLPELVAALSCTTTACRGPKPAAALARLGLSADIRAAEPHTTDALLDVLDAVELRGQGIAVIHYGERNETFAHALAARSARLFELCLYEWRLPADTGPLQALVREVIRGEVQAVAFTSQVQARHLLEVAAMLGLRAELVAALNTRCVVASLAPTCLAALRGFGVEPAVVPQHARMGHLVEALDHRFADRI